jgi:SAM-dependent methyltransferase
MKFQAPRTKFQDQWIWKLDFASWILLRGVVMSNLMMVKDGHLGGYIHGGDPGTWCPYLWSWVVKEFQIQSVLDIGCGEGRSTKFFHDLGCEVLGVDGCEQAIHDSVIPEHVVLHDFCEGPFVPERSFDLIWSCEFLEHVGEEYVPNILGTFAHAAKVILATHAFPERKSRARSKRHHGHHHVNCRPSSYWIRHIEGAGFECQVAGTRRARTMTLADYPGINHFARSGLLFTKSQHSSHGGFGPHWKALRINWGFRWSAAYREQQRRRRAIKRQNSADIS